MKWVFVSISASTTWLFLVLTWHTLEAKTSELVPTLPMSYLDTGTVVPERYAVFPKSSSTLPRVRLHYVPPTNEATVVVKTTPQTVVTSAPNTASPVVAETSVTQPRTQPSLTSVSNDALSVGSSNQALSGVVLSAVHTFSVLTNRVFDETNNARQTAGVSPLRQSAVLAAAARSRSEDMARRGYFAHESPDGCDLECHTTTIAFDANSWGENIAWYEPYYFLTETELGEHFVREWLKSSGHRRNMLNEDFTHQGIGVALDGEKIIVTVIFAKQSSNLE